MDASAIGRELEELETRVERLRALYEQYFMGIERLEPQIPRKEVERRIHLLRKEQIRNTALRFKFQMLIQRYNTLQQYWARVTREIESGTYRRDVMRAAARFGEKEALTILGKKRARQYAALAEAQAELKKRPTASDLEEEEVELGAEDFIDDDETATSSAEIELGAPEAFLLKGKPDVVAPVPARRSGVGPPPVPPPLPAARGSSPSIAPPGRSSSPSIAPPGRSSSPSIAPPGRSSSPSIAPAPLLPKPPPPPPAAPPATPGLGGLRWGGPEPRRASVLPPPLTASEDTAPAAQPVALAEVPSAAAPPAAPPLPEKQPAPPAVAAKRPPPAGAPMAVAPAPAAKAADESLGEPRIRQLYAKYVETKRKANESTAGVTYEKLAATLRAQTQRLREAHPTKTIDYEVVVKDGRTQLKPILR